MANVAKHIKVARERGAEAGLEVFLSAPISRRYPAYKRIVRKRTPEAQLREYCAIYGLSPEPVTETSVKKRSKAQRADVLQLIAELLAQEFAEDEPEFEDEPEDEPEPKDEPEPVRTTPRGITREQAWMALGADPAYKPRNGDELATNGQLWRLNQAGLLSIPELF
jgi:hypothetical protein